MRWKGRQQSGNVEDRRSIGGRKMVAGGTIGTIAIIVIIYLLGGNPTELLNSIQAPGNSAGIADSSVIQAEEELAQFASVTLKDTEDVWNDLFGKMGKEYREPVLVLFTGSTQSACGYSSAATGPFYCPGDEKVYIDLSFLDELQQKLQAEGDFAMAYIIAHEVGHHVQRLLGIMDKLDEIRGKVDEKEYNEYSVRLELQADFLAGIWAHYAQKTKNILEEGDVEEAINVASAVGDDRIQMQSQGYVVPDAFTHGTSEQRKTWFLKGFRTGSLEEGDTFKEQI